MNECLTTLQLKIRPNLDYVPSADVGGFRPHIIVSLPQIDFLDPPLVS